MPTALQQRGLLLLIAACLLVGGALLVANQIAAEADLVSASRRPDPSLVVFLDAAVLMPTFPEGEACIDLNQATEQQLIRLSGIGEVLAARIVADRELRGPFETVDDLIRVSGIGPVLIEAIRDDVTVDGSTATPSASASDG